MRSKLRNVVLLVAAVLGPLGAAGCTPFNPGFYPFSMGLATPIPVPPWVTDRMEEKYKYQNDFRTPILPPVREGFPEPICEDPPDDAHVLRVMPKVARGVPYIYEEFRDDIQIVTERLVDRIDPPRFFPLVGWARLHHCHWKCTVYYTETIQSDWPFPVYIRKPRVQVVYIDKDHLHLCPGGSQEAQDSVTRDLLGP
jgi:hypothetical protein